MEAGHPLRIEAVSTGDELLGGVVLDANAATLGRALARAGLDLARVTVVGDGEDDIAAVLGEVAARADVVVVSGGLGSTEDDRTLAAAARVAGRPSVGLPQAVGPTGEGCLARGAPPASAAPWKTLLPEGAEVVPNPVGTAAGIVLRLGGCLTFLLPGVPKEYASLLRSAVVPRILEEAVGRGQAPLAVASASLRVFGLPEGRVGELLADLPRPHGARVSFRVEHPETIVGLSVRGADPSSVRRELAALVEGARKRLGRHAYSEGGRGLPEVVGGALARAGLTLAVAESCTGGLLGEIITRVPGSSAYFLGGFVTYSNALKEALLGVPRRVLEEHGAVSETCARAMASGARKATGASVAVAITGIAGPGGGSRAKPVGTVHIALDLLGDVRHVAHRLPGDREEVRRASALWALFGLLGVLEEGAEPFRKERT